MPCQGSCILFLFSTWWPNTVSFSKLQMSFLNRLRCQFSCSVSVNKSTFSVTGKSYHESCTCVCIYRFVFHYLFKCTPISICPFVFSFCIFFAVFGYLAVFGHKLLSLPISLSLLVFETYKHKFQ